MLYALCSNVLVQRRITTWKCVCENVKCTLTNFWQVFVVHCTIKTFRPLCVMFSQVCQYVYKCERQKICCKYLVSTIYENMFNAIVR